VAEEFISFDKVLRELQMQEEELKRLVSEGEIRAFRDQDKMKFKKEDVERFRRARDTSKDDTLAKEEVPEELVFDEDDANQEVGMATAAIADDSFLEEEAAPAPESEVAPEEAPAPAAKMTSGRSRGATGSARKRLTVDEEDRTEGAIWKIAIIAATLVMIFGSMVAMDAARAKTSGLTRGVADMFKPK
jgi:hypothetical protein